MSSSTTPRQLRDAGADDVQTAIADAATYIADRGGNPALNTDDMNDQLDDIAIIEHLDRITAESTEARERVEKAEELAQKFQDDVGYGLFMDRTDERHSADDLIINEFKDMCMLDEKLAMRLHDLVMRLGTDVIAARDQEAQEVRAMVKFTREYQEILITEQKVKADQDEAHKRLLQQLVESSAQRFKEEREKNVGLQAELATRPVGFQVQDADKEREKTLKRLLETRLDLEDQDFPTRWSELNSLIQSFENMITSTMKADLDRIMLDSETIINGLKESYDEALNTLVIEQEMHNETKMDHQQAIQENVNLDNQLKASERIVEEMNDKAGRRDQEIASLTDTVSSMADNIESQTRQNDRLQTDIRTREQEMQNLNQENHDLKQELATSAAQQGGDVRLWTERYNAEVEKLRKSQDENSRLQTENGALQMRLSTAQQKASNESARAALAEQLRDSEVGRADILTIEKTGLQNVIAAKDNEILRLLGQAVSAQTRYDAEVRIVAQLNENIQDMQKATEKMRMELKSEKEQAVSVEVARTKELEQRRYKDHEDSLKTLKEHHQQMKDLRTEINDFKINEARNATQIDTLRTAHDARKREMDELKGENDKLRDDLSVNQAKVNDLSRGTTEATAEVQAVSVERDRAVVSRNEALQDRETISKLYNDLKRVMLFHGFGVAQDVNLEDLLQRLDQPYKITPADFRERCRLWQEAIPSKAEQITAVEV